MLVSKPLTNIVIMTYVLKWCDTQPFHTRCASVMYLPIINTSKYCTTTTTTTTNKATPDGSIYVQLL